MYLDKVSSIIHKIEKFNYKNTFFTQIWYIDKIMLLNFLIINLNARP